MPPSLKNSFSFEYGPLDDGTYWIQTPSKKLININQLSLDILFKLNDGLPLQEISQSCDVPEEEINELIGRMSKEKVIVEEGQGRIREAAPVKDIRLYPFVLMWIVLAVIQAGYFKYMAHTYLMEKWQEGVAVLIIAIIATLGHELGHYVVSKKYFKPKMGFTFMLFVFPAFYVDTHESWKLPRGIRILINLSGSLVDLAVNTAVMCAVLFFPKLEYYATPFIITQFSRWALVLNPLFPTDFYWILCDVTKTVNLSQKAKENLFKLKPNLLSLYALLSYAFLALAFYWLGLFLFSIGTNLFPAIAGWISSRS